MTTAGRAKASRWSQAGLGASHSFAVREDGTLWIWGPRFFPHAGILGQYLHVPTRLDLD